MSEPSSYSLSRYLKAKQTVDERALNRRVRSQFVGGLVDRRRSRSGALKILELAGGIGSGAARILGTLSDARVSPIEYTLVDIDSQLVDAAHEYIRKWGRDAGFDIRVTADRIVLARARTTMSVRLVAADAFKFLAEEASSDFDAVITQAWLDLVNLETVLERTFRVLSDEGLFYAPISFDGATRFLPIVDQALDQKILRLYHRSLDDRDTAHGPAGGSKTGSRLLTVIPSVGGRIEAVGPSDWIVRPHPPGRYPEDEEYFLYHIVRFIRTELDGSDELPTEHVDSWLSRRHSEIQNADLRYLAHQVDVLASTPDV